MEKPSSFLNSSSRGYAQLRATDLLNHIYIVGVDGFVSWRFNGGQLNQLRGGDVTVDG